MGFEFYFLMAEELQVELQIKYMVSGEPFTTLKAARSSTGMHLRRELDKELPPGKAVQHLFHDQHLVMDPETLGDCGIPDGEAVLFAVVESLPNAALHFRGYTPCDLKLRGYVAADMKEAGYPVSALRKAQFTANDLWEAGYTAISLRKGGYSAAEVRDAGYFVEDMRKAGFSAADLKHTGCTARDLFYSGYSLEQISCLGYTAGAITVAYLERCGDMAADRLWLRRQALLGNLVCAGYTEDCLLDAGWDFNDVVDWMYAEGSECDFEELSVMSETQDGFPLEARSEITRGSRQQKRRRDAQQRARRHNALQKRRNRASAEERRQRQLLCRHLHTFTCSRAHATNRKKMMMLDGKRKKRGARLPEDHWIASEGQEPHSCASVSSKAASDDDDVEWAELAYLASFVQWAELGYPDSF